MQLLCQQRKWILIAALLAGERASSFINIFFKMHGEVTGLADGGAKPPDYPDYSPAQTLHSTEIPAGMGYGAGSGLNPQPKA